MTGQRQALRIEDASNSIGGRLLDSTALVVNAADVAVSALTFALSVAVLWTAMRGVPIGLIAALHGGVICVPLAFSTLRMRTGRDLAVPLLLLIVVMVSGPLGAAGCAAMTLALWLRRPDPRRLQCWYDYIAGVSRRTAVEETYVELTSKRLLTDFSAPIHRFDPILNGTSLAQQQRVLGVIGRNYHPDFRATLKKALRNRNILIRAQGAAIASVLASEDKTRLWRPASVEARRPELARIENAERAKG
jgi:hypothetical protein